MLNPTRLHQTFIDLCRIPSPSGQEGRVAEYIRNYVARLGLTIEEDDTGPALGSDTGNLLVRCEGQGDPLFLAAHMDTVAVPFTDEIPVVIEGDRVHTNGQSILGGDDKAGITVALEILANAVENPGQAYPLEVIFTIQEEQGLGGAKHFDTTKLKAKEGYVLDGDTPVGSAMRRSVYKYRYYVEVQGRKAHAAVEPEKGINAIKAMGAVIAKLPTGRLDEESVANLGQIEGGGVINAVPDRARLVGELRSLNPERLKDIQQEFETIVAQETAQHGATGTIEWIELYPGYFVPDEAPCAQRFAAASQAEGFTPSFHTTLGGSDANRFNNQGLPCIVFGLGMEAIHTHEEFMLLSRLDESVRILQRMVGLGGR